jgi:hypothetical protein
VSPVDRVPNKMLSGRGAACGSPGTAAGRLETLCPLLAAGLLTALLTGPLLLLTTGLLDVADVLAALLSTPVILEADGVPATLAQAVNAAAASTAPPRLAAKAPTRRPISQQPLSCCTLVPRAGVRNRGC